MATGQFHNYLGLSILSSTLGGSRFSRPMAAQPLRLWSVLAEGVKTAALACDCTNSQL